LAAVALITGATGLIGRHVLRQWDVPGMRPVAVDRRTDDLLRPGAAAAVVRRLAPAVVVHLAWTASGTPGYRTDSANDTWVESSLELAEASRRSGAWLLATGTPLDSGCGSTDAYSAAKARLRGELQPAVDAGAITWLRPYYVVDPGRRRPALVDEALAARATGARMSLRSPDAAHDFVHASDVGAAIVLAIREDLRGEVPIGSGRLRRVCDLVSALGVAWHPEPQNPLTQGPAPTPQHHEAADIGRLRQHGFEPSATEEMFDGG